MSKEITVPQSTLDQQFSSSNPENSAWVAANAGSGKTHVLTQRVIRLMLAGSPPDRILCLTFTKAAAANMKTRIFNTLAKWVMLDDQVLRKTIRDFTGEEVDVATLARARSLFASALDAPGGLKIQTIHAFCEAVLHQFPLEANVPGHFETLQDATRANLLREARGVILSGKGASAGLIEHYRALTRLVSTSAIDTALGEVIYRRRQFLDWTSIGIAPAMAPLYVNAGIDPDESEEEYLSRIFRQIPLDPNALKQLKETAFLSDKAKDNELSEQLGIFLNEGDPHEKLEQLRKIGLKKDGGLRKTTTYPTKYVKERLPEAEALIVACGEAALHLQDRLNTHRVLAISFHLYHLGQAVLEHYETAKRALGAVDFDDLIERAANLLCRADMREWIRYRLDQGIDHMLVDEAQDTSPRQWEIINAVTADFHSGANAARAKRTIFVVGDEKQSIYSFQGAEPAEFSRQQKMLETSVRHADQPYHAGKLNLSFRSTPDVLHAVDRVFEDEDNRRGLEQSGEKPTHDAVRGADPGEVLVWPLYVAEKVEETEDWLAPLDQPKPDDPAVQLARRITHAIGDWVRKPLPGSAEPLKFSDILVLVRKRDRFITALTRTMKDAGLAVAGADRIVLTEHIAVEDLLALGQFALLPDDDLMLASVLKSVFFNLSEERLFDLAHGRETSLMASLIDQANDEAAPDNLQTREIVQRLQLVRQQARKLDVFEFYAWVLGPFGGRKAFLSRLGSEAEDVIDAFLEETIAFTRDGNIGLENFIGSLQRAKPEIKREVELERDEVRILTVHAAKGLEAKVVFLVDPCTPPWSPTHQPKILDVSGDGQQGMLWFPTAVFATSQSAKTVEGLKAAAEEEYRRLLYVGMTRAADRLIVCGYQGKRPPKERHWHQMVSEALDSDGEKICNEHGEAETLVWHSSKSPASRPVNDSLTVAAVETYKEPAPGLPEWLKQPAQNEPPLPYPLSPSGAHALISDDELPAMSTQQREAGSQAFALQRGNAIHKLLETLPDIGRENREPVARAWLARNKPQWKPVERENVWNDVSAVLNSPDLKHYFELPSRAEVAVAGQIATRTGTRMIAGQIDRLVTGDGIVHILDYKTSRNPPQSPGDIPPVYITQLALYREIIAQIYPGKEIECSIIWTFGPTVTAIARARMDEAIVNIRNS